LAGIAAGKENKAGERNETSFVSLPAKRERHNSRGNQVTLQPPLPLQEFLPLQPMSPVWQPPWPLQLFIPLQSCLAVALSVELALVPVSLLQPVTAVMVPATNPAIAAESINVRAVRVINVNVFAVLIALNEQ